MSGFDLIDRKQINKLSILSFLCDCREVSIWVFDDVDHEYVRGLLKLSIDWMIRNRLINYRFIIFMRLQRNLVHDGMNNTKIGEGRAFGAPGIA